MSPSWPCLIQGEASDTVSCRCLPRLRVRVRFGSGKRRPTTVSEHHKLPRTRPCSSTASSGERMKVVMVKLEHTQQQMTTTFRAFTTLHTTIHDFTLQQQQNLHYFCITPQQFQQFAACPGENPFFPRESGTTPKGNAPVEQPTRNEEAPHVVVEPQ
ncbi:hypothetical protein DEO72_LG8g1938 [Vigna unguiculata]|uniref:Uncharacterized protein n=1 Tax=Vigna unguiculata TaxID=3917 RepID=A0A4D6MS56_VIGUN|nr:hypothetical protein DEO72_LG8g1938 [Vigna unguiculata]